MVLAMSPERRLTEPCDSPIVRQSVKRIKTEFVFRGSIVDQKLFDAGLATRREVLGAEYVDQSIKNADDFNRPLQELVTQYCWGDVWNRPGLERKTRSFLNLAMLTALNRPHELKLHIKGALNNGVTKEEIKEVFLQTAIYCGVPAAIDSFRVAKEAFKEVDA
jgi:4-carboxymuconolactone decarboxylase